MAALCPSRKAKSAAANLSMAVLTPRLQRSRWSRSLVEGAMPLIDYSKAFSFCDSTEAVSVVLQHALVQLRDHVKFQE